MAGRAQHLCRVAHFSYSLVSCCLQGIIAYVVDIARQRPPVAAVSHRRHRSHRCHGRKQTWRTLLLLAPGLIPPGGCVGAGVCARISHLSIGSARALPPRAFNRPGCWGDRGDVLIYRLDGEVRDLQGGVTLPRGACLHAASLSLLLGQAGATTVAVAFLPQNTQAARLGDTKSKFWEGSGASILWQESLITHREGLLQE